MIYIETYVKIVLVNMLWAYFTLVRDNDMEDKDIIPVSVITGFLFPLWWMNRLASWDRDKIEKKDKDK